MSREIPRLRDVPGFKEDRDSQLSKALGKLRRDFGLVGVVLVDFTSDRVGVSSSGSTDAFSRHMERLGDRILAAIDAGQFDPGADQ